MRLRQRLLAFAIVAAIGPLTAQAGIVEPFNLLNGAGGSLVAGATGLDWNATGSGVAIGVGPFSDSNLLPLNAQFSFKYQANLATVVGGVATPAFTTGLDSTANGTGDSGTTFEITIVANMKEFVRSAAFTGPGNTDPAATFGVVSDPGNKVAIYFDTAKDAKTSDGTGFDNGIKIAQFTIDAGEPGFNTLSSFQALTGTGAGQGSTKIHASLSGAGDFVDANYLQGIVKFIFDADYQSSLNYPAGTSATSGFHIGGDAAFPNYLVATNDIVFKVDGDNQFTYVPEPGTLLLLAIGLLGCGVFGGRGRRGGQVEVA